MWISLWTKFSDRKCVVRLAKSLCVCMVNNNNEIIPMRARQQPNGANVIRLTGKKNILASSLFCSSTHLAFVLFSQAHFKRECRITEHQLWLYEDTKHRLYSRFYDIFIGPLQILMFSGKFMRPKKYTQTSHKFWQKKIRTRGCNTLLLNVWYGHCCAMKPVNDELVTSVLVNIAMIFMNCIAQ